MSKSMASSRAQLCLSQFDFFLVARFLTFGHLSNLSIDLSVPRAVAGVTWPRASTEETKTKTDLMRRFNRNTALTKAVLLLFGNFSFCLHTLYYIIYILYIIYYMVLYYTIFVFYSFLFFFQQWIQL